MPEYSGVAAVVNRKDPVEQPIGEQMTGMMERILQIKSAKQSMAQAKLKSTMDMVAAGFPVNDKEMTKMIKQSGLPISTRPEDIIADIAGHKKMQAKDAQQPASPSGTGAGISGVAAGAAKAGKEQMQPQKMDLKTPEGQQSYWNQIAEQARRRQTMQAATDEQKQKNELLVEKTKEAALNGDEAAQGKLIFLGFGHFDIGYANWAKMTSEQRGKAAAMASGAESDAQIAERSTKVAEDLMTSGRMTDPSAAFTAARELVATGHLSANTQGKVKPFTFRELADQSEMASNLVQLGVPPEMIGKTLNTASVSGLQNALPTGLKPIALQGLKLQQQQVSLEGKQLDIETQKYKAETERLAKLDHMAEMQELKEEDKQTLDMFRAGLDAKKAGNPFPKDLMHGLMAKVANIAGMDTEEVEHWYGNSYNFVPKTTPGDQATIKKLAGPKAANAPDASTMQGIIHGVKRSITKGVGDVVRSGMQQDDENTQRGPI